MKLKTKLIVLAIVALALVALYFALAKFNPGYGEPGTPEAAGVWPTNK